MAIAPAARNSPELAVQNQVKGMQLVNISFSDCVKTESATAVSFESADQWRQMVEAFRRVATSQFRPCSTALKLKSWLAISFCLVGRCRKRPSTFEIGHGEIGTEGDAVRALVIQLHIEAAILLHFQSRVLGMPFLPKGSHWVMRTSSLNGHQGIGIDRGKLFLREPLCRCRRGKAEADRSHQ